PRSTAELAARLWVPLVVVSFMIVPEFDLPQPAQAHAPTARERGRPSLRAHAIGLTLPRYAGHEKAATNRHVPGRRRAGYTGGRGEEMGRSKRASAVRSATRSSRFS